MKWQKWLHSYSNQKHHYREENAEGEHLEEDGRSNRKWRFFASVDACLKPETITKSADDVLVPENTEPGNYLAKARPENTGPVAKAKEHIRGATFYNFLHQINRVIKIFVISNSSLNYEW